MLKSGKRIRQTGRDIIEQAQLRAGSAKYRKARLVAGEFATDSQKEILRKYREDLHKRYPGFPIVASFDPGEFPSFIDKLRKIVDDPRTKENASAQTIKKYLSYRDAALRVAEQNGYSSRTLTGKALSPVRYWLVGRAQELIKENPEFARVYDRELAAELEE